MKIAVFVMAIMVMCICPGRISEEKDLVLVEQRRPKDCRSPKGKHGSVRNDGCIQSTCTNGKWKPQMRTDICCYKQQVHKPNTVLDKIVSADNCSSTTVGCGAVAQLEFNHRTCATPSSKQQVEKLETNLEQKIEQVAAKFENVTETSNKQADEINQKLDKKVQEINSNIETLENNITSHVNDLSDKVESLENNMESHVNDLSDKVETLENNITSHVNDLSDKVESLAQTVNDNIADQAEMSLEMMRTLANLTQMMVKHTNVWMPNPISFWNFEDSLEDSSGLLNGHFVGGGKVIDGALVLDGTGYVKTSPIQSSLKAKTFEVWVLLNELQPTAEGIISISYENYQDPFDAIVFSEKPYYGMWLAGSDYHSRTKGFSGPKETKSKITGANIPVHLVMVYDSKGTVSCYRNGQLYGTPFSTKGPHTFTYPAVILFGLRHLPNRGYSKSSIYQASLYNVSLEPVQVIKLYKKGYKTK